MRAIAAHLAAHAIAPSLEVLLTEYPSRDFSMVDVCAAGITKGTGLAAVAARFGVAQDEVMAVGDNHNDLGMLALGRHRRDHGQRGARAVSRRLSRHRQQR